MLTSSAVDDARHPPTPAGSAAAPAAGRRRPARAAMTPRLRAHRDGRAQRGPPPPAAMTMPADERPRAGLPRRSVVCIRRVSRCIAPSVALTASIRRRGAPPAPTVSRDESSCVIRSAASGRVAIPASCAVVVTRFVSHRADHRPGLVGVEIVRPGRCRVTRPRVADERREPRAGVDRAVAYDCDTSSISTTEASPAAQAEPGHQTSSFQVRVTGPASPSRTRADRCSQKSGDGSGTSLAPRRSRQDRRRVARPRCGRRAGLEVATRSVGSAPSSEVDEFFAREMAHCSSFLRLASA